MDKEQNKTGKQVETGISAFDTRIRWSKFCLMWISTSSIFMFYLFSNIVTACIVGAFTCWLISFTFMGPWLVHGLHLLTIDIATDDLYKLGAAAGFFAGFLKFKIEK